MENPLVEITQGKLIGTVSQDIDGNFFYSFRGIPYAKPPLGKLRFKAPLPPTPWQGIFQATDNGSCCYSKDIFKNEYIGSEDCLNLNVYTPSLPGRGNTSFLPVMVWVHVGGFVTGSNGSDIYGPEFLITGNVVLVVINYRLGLLGFLGLEDPAAGVPGNAGFKDMVMALEWVKSNIIYFGGDPNNVTIFGGSAGGASVHYLMLSPMARGLFHKAIAQSGCGLNPWARGRKADEEIYKVYGCEDKSDTELLDHLQQLPVEILIKNQSKLNYFLETNRINVYGLVIERKAEEQGEIPFLCEDPLEIILSGKFTDVPFMIGHTKYEGVNINMFSPKKITNVITDSESNVSHFLGYKTGSKESKSVGEKIKQFYFGNEEPSRNNRSPLYEMVADNWFLYGIYSTVRLHAKHMQCPVYFYKMSIKTSLKFLQALVKIDADKGAAHGDEVAYLFRTIITPPLSPHSIEYIYIKKFVKLWTNFAYFGNPTPDTSSVIWKKASNEQIGFLHIDQEITFHPTFHYRNLQFWDKLYSESPSGKGFCKLDFKI